LGQQGYFKNEAFLEYLRYLTYFLQPNYAKYLMYPSFNGSHSHRYPYALEILELLQHSSFRDFICSAEASLFLHHKQFFLWKYYRNARLDNK
jgi:mediator of RNA polymerase II transcription subunit 31